jgi:hypothetical protein
VARGDSSPSAIGLAWLGAKMSVGFLFIYPLMAMLLVVLVPLVILLLPLWLAGKAIVGIVALVHRVVSAKD